MDPSRDFNPIDIQQFTTLVYDEGFGPSGRLLVCCDTLTGTRLLQFLNQEELNILEESLWNSGYYRHPGIDTKPFDMTMCIFEMLYGTEIVDIVLERYEEKRTMMEEERIKKEEQERKEEELLAIAPGADDCDLEVDANPADAADKYVADADEGDGDSHSFEIIDVADDEGEGM